MLAKRLRSIALFVPLVLVTTYLGGIWFFLFVALVALVAGHEYYRLLEKGGYQPQHAAGLALIALFVLAHRFPDQRLAEGTLAGGVMVLLTWQVFRGNAPGSLASWGLTLAGAIYLGWLPGHFVALRRLIDGLWWVLLTLAITWVCDSAAYIVGHVWGKHRFFPKISPRKTLEGAIGGLVFGLVTPLAFTSILPLSWAHALLLGLAGSVASTFGDLGESVIKRQIGVKDSSNLIPGHGGMMDRIDSLLFNVVIVYYYAYWILGIR